MTTTNLVLDVIRCVLANLLHLAEHQGKMPKLKSSVWEYFDRLHRADGSKYSKCNVEGCSVELSGHVASNAKRHLLTVHGIDVEATDRTQRLENPTVIEQLAKQLQELRGRVSDFGGHLATCGVSEVCRWRTKETKRIVQLATTPEVGNWTGLGPKIIVRPLRV